MSAFEPTGFYATGSFDKDYDGSDGVAIAEWAGPAKTLLAAAEENKEALDLYATYEDAPVIQVYELVHVGTLDDFIKNGGVSRA